MVDWILLELLIGTAILFVGLTLDEVTRQMEIRRSSLASPLEPNGVANEPTADPMIVDEEERQAA